MNHTKGPWIFKDESILAKIKQDDYAEAYTLVASIPNHFGRVNSHNANLIAAAPEMLEALEAALMDMTDLVDFTDDEATDTKEHLKEILKLMQNAIKKAKG